MALRVLLADNSETIKKVIQLTLQDYAAEVKSVHSGVDVLDVVRSYKPDIIFADILLQKRNGYEICQDIKSAPDLNKIPVVLMWSGFMDLDHGKAEQAKANATLEKPFDSNELRNLIAKLVPKVGANPLSQFLTVPGFEKTDIPVTPPAVATPTTPTPPAATPLPAAPEKPEGAEWNMEAFEDINEFQIKEPGGLPDLGEPFGGEEDFAQVPIQSAGQALAKAPEEKAPPKAALPPKPTKSGFDLDVPDETDFDGVTVSIVMPQEEITNMDFLLTSDGKKSAPNPVPTPSAPKPAAQELPTNPNIPKPIPTAPAASAAPQMSEEQLETLLKGQSQEIIEKIVWKLVPDLAERIIRDEIKRLLEEPDLKA